MKCPACGEPAYWDGSEGQTLVGYGRGDCGEVHDDNCRKRGYFCGGGHMFTVCLRRTCPKCDWKGRETCFCHLGAKVDAWPDAPKAMYLSREYY